MEKRYQKIADRLDVPSNAVHLIHYIMSNMKSACVFPPSKTKNQTHFFSPINICSALLAYIKETFEDDKWDTLDEFGLTDSVQVGKIVEELNSNWWTRVVKGLDVDLEEYEGLFSSDTGAAKLPQVSWLDDELTNQFKVPQETYLILNRHFSGLSIEDYVVRNRTFPRTRSGRRSVGTRKYFHRTSRL